VRTPDINSLPNSRTLLGRALRAPLQLIPKSSVVKILRGPLRGNRWIVGSGIHRIWLGGFEPAKMALAVSLTSRDDLAIDIGANVGVYTLLFSRAVGTGGRVIAIEPNPDNLVFIRHHLMLNAIDNVTVIAAAVADRVGTVSFDCSDNSSTGRIDTHGALAVPCVTVDDVIDQFRGRASVIKIDVEGGELNVLKGAAATLTNHRPVVLLATHSPALRHECARFLESLDYRVALIDGSSDPDEWLAQPAKTPAGAGSGLGGDGRTRARDERRDGVSRGVTRPRRGGE
jgi:FkbM family methyltransferase